MRKFTKGLLLTFVASAMSLGANAQDAFDGYFRIINVGYNTVEKFKTGYMYISDPLVAQPQKTADESITLPGTVMYLKADKITEVPEELGKYEDVTENDLEVSNLRSQGVDANAAIYKPMVDLLRGGFINGLKYLNMPNKENWGFKDAEIESLVDEMFTLMKMYMEPAGKVGDKDAWYLKSTTPNTKPLVDALNEKQIEIDFEGKTPTEWAWDKLVWGALDYYQSIGADQLYDQWYQYVFYEDRIHIGHTYYLIGGRVLTDLKTYQRHDAGQKKGEYISFANNNKYYTIDGFMPEIEVANEAGDFAKWIVEPVVKGTETTGTDYFAVKGGVEGLDGHFYTSIYTDFPMEIVDNGETVEYGGNTVRVWGIPNGPVIGEFDTSNGMVGYVTTTEYKLGDIIPARTPVVVECLKTARENNLLNPVLTPMSEDPHGESFLKGIFFEEFFNEAGEADDDEFTYYYMPLEQGTTVARKLIRVLNKGNNALNPVGFFKFGGASIAPNKAFMILDSSMANANIFMVDSETYEALGISEVATATNENATIYDIQGRVVSNPTKGLYIVNGKKMVIK